MYCLWILDEDCVAYWTDCMETFDWPRELDVTHCPHCGREIRTLNPDADTWID